MSTRQLNPFDGPHSLQYTRPIQAHDGSIHSPCLVTRIASASSRRGGCGTKYIACVRRLVSPSGHAIVFFCHHNIEYLSGRQHLHVYICYVLYIYIFFFLSAWNMLFRVVSTWITLQRYIFWWKCSFCWRTPSRDRPPPRVFSGWNGIQAASGVRDPTRIRESVNRFLQKHQPEFRGEGYLLAFVGELFVGYGRMPIYPFTSSVAPQAYKNSISSHKLGGFSCTCLSVCFAVVGVLIIVLGLYRGADYIWKI